MPADPAIVARLRTARSALFLPASNPRAIEKARTLGADLVILDCEDAVKPEDKDAAREAAVAAAAGGFGDALVAIRVNGTDHPAHDADCAAVRESVVHMTILPMVADAESLARFAAAVGKPVGAMVETPAAVLDAATLARVPGVVALIAGTNDLCAATGIRSEPGRAGLATALQTILLAARAAGVAAFDGVYNRLDDAAGFEAEARQGAAWGFDGKSLIHPSQVEPANRAFSPDAVDIEDARALVAAAGEGATRFRGRMVEALHVEAARRLLIRARAISPGA